MKHSKFRKPMAFLLALMLCVTMISPAFAVKIQLPSSNSSSYSWSWSSILEGLGNLFGISKNNTKTNTAEDIADPELTLVEDETTVEEGTELRASTYMVQAPTSTTKSANARIAGDQNEENNTLKYFPVTMFNYDDRINEATRTTETADGVDNMWEGLYFNGGEPATDSYSWRQIPYAPYNVWTNKIFDEDDEVADAVFGELSLRVKNPNNQVGDRAGYVYNGLVESELNHGRIQFTVPEGGIFDSSDTTTKDVYTNVGLPFVYDSETGYYTFDASQDSARFDGEPKSNVNLTWNDMPQNNPSQGANGFYPFNDSLKVDGADYHFGMIATVPFSMTVDGKVSSTNQDDIEFDFAGDDDVWVFIDGKLVLDMGGIHNSVSGTMNFAQNTSVVKATNEGDGSGYLNMTDGAKSGEITGQLFNEVDQNGEITSTGILGQTRETFASTDEHTLTVYYLERGQGSSNCKLYFNLPMKDTVSVQKQVAETDSAGDPLSQETLDSINNRHFTFTLYKDDEPVADTAYNLYSADNQYLDTVSTDAQGKFVLQNGQTATFTGDIAAEGSSYYVAEEKDGSAWEIPMYTYTATGANGVDETPANKEDQSKVVTVKGSDEAEDSLAFVCENTFTHVNETSIEATDDEVVIDYGLPVMIDVLANDTAVKGTKSIYSINTSTLKYGTATIVDNQIQYELTKPIDDVEVLKYTAKATGSNSADTATDEATVYIIPATTVYYEENFSDMVTFSEGWTLNDDQSGEDFQEDGEVGDTTDSLYGSDVAYLHDSKDSNGTNMYADTTKGAQTFSYTFTGTGTAFFARTTNDSGYMRVIITDATGKTVHSSLCDTRYHAQSGDPTLYNIPVFSYDADAYGTYTVTVTIAGGENAVKSFGTNFWLDGIRVVNPLNPDVLSTTADPDLALAESAYAADGEVNMIEESLRDKLLQDYTIVDDKGNLQWDGENFVVFTDSNHEITSASEYESNGPKEEVYLYQDQSITFSLKNWDPNTNQLYLGLKSPAGHAIATVNGHEIELENTVDCYYDITDFGDVQQAGDGTYTITFEVSSKTGLVSATNIRVTGAGDPDFTIIEKNPEEGEGNEDVNVDIDIDGAEGDENDIVAKKES